MERAKVILLGVARPGFDTDLALRLYRDTIALVERLGCEVMHPAQLVTDPEDAGRLAAQYRDASADALIIQFSTFVDGRFLTRIVQELDVPLLLWALPEPELGGRLRLNSLTGANLASSLLVALGRRFQYTYALPGDPQASKDAGRWLTAAVTARRLRTAVVAEVGNPPPGFYTSAVNSLELLRLVGPRVVHLDLATLFQKASMVPSERYLPVIEADRKTLKDLDQLVPEQVIKSAQLYVALRDMLAEAQAAAVAMRCWPETFSEYKAAACSTLSRLTDEGLPAACESDLPGAVTMLMQYCLTGQPTYFGDLVYADRENNTAIFWHCGFGAYSLASRLSGPVAGVQPNRHFGLALNNGLKGGQVTIARLGQSRNGFRMFIARGEALDKPNRFHGTSVEVRLFKPVGEFLDALIYSGFEHHFALVWEDVAGELAELCSILNIPCTTF
ncbi:MAG: L-fucose/L-arabinose isomerase family protein [Betaproteobacteria bacterium]